MPNSICLKVLATIVSFAPFVSTNPIFQRDITLPSQDPFYYPPEGFENKPPGTILSHRPPPSPLSAFGKIPLNLYSAHQILYRTTSARGDASHTVSTVFIPHDANYSRVVSQQDFMDSACFDCSTSYALQQHASHKTLQSQASILYIAGLLEHKYIVSVPDYEGSKASFSCGLSSGYALLDSLRALMNSCDFTGVSENADIVMWGYSGGSIPTQWAAQLHTTYAPELNILGAAAGGSIVNVESTIRSINGGDSAGYAPSGIIGLMAEYPRLEKILKEDLVPETADEFYKAKTRCAMPNSDCFKGKDIKKYFKTGFDLFDHSEVKEIIKETGTMGLRGTPKMPLHMYKTVNDAIAPIANDDALVAKYCADGGQVQYERNLRGSHPLESILGSSSAMVFLRDLLEGKGAPPGCSTTDVEFLTPNWDVMKEMGESVMGLLGELLSKNAIEVAEQYAEEKMKGWWHKMFGFR
ncbi:hypothetical protein DID88_005706 [Monilinia fructigena]|uniref:Uncharacterized protein n=1 Tax=Monilinia fructigena TaxID=38457 RepID=A0A395J0J8_9HELO|nr:hypothetical protein DID88_005706 [Monilinia fructigena]